MEKEKKRHYVAPTTTLHQIEVESPICGGSVISPTQEQNITIKEQEFNTKWNGDFTGSSWDDLSSTSSN